MADPHNPSGDELVRKVLIDGRSTSTDVLRVIRVT